MRTLLVSLLLLAAVSAAAGSRPPAVAGAFYPANADELRRQVGDL
jgi:hypothetical protein